RVAAALPGHDGGRRAVPAPAGRGQRRRRPGRRRVRDRDNRRLPLVGRGRPAGPAGPGGRLRPRGAPAAPERRGGGRPADRPAPRPAGRGSLLVRRCGRPGAGLAVTFDTRPRLTYPSRRIDALRGTAAVERGPLVYCFEQADQPAGVSVEDVTLRPGGLRERPGTLPGGGRTVVTESDAVQLPPAAAGRLPYPPRPGGDNRGRPMAAVAVPYFQWDNRDGRAMRVWMPLSRADSPADIE